MTKIKICGIRHMDAAQAARQADFIGFIMSDKYRRFCPPDVVRSISQAITGPAKVGVFVDQDWQEVNELAQYCGLDYVQLHGHEDEAYAATMSRPVIKAFRYGEDFSLDRAEAYPAEIILIDSYSKHVAGGSGISFAWQEAARSICQLGKPYMIAGGISAQTVQEAIKIFSPYGIDASGAMEIDGVKSPRLISEFLQAGRVRENEGLFGTDS